jgi:hypothetical protein
MKRNLLLNIIVTFAVVIIGGVAVSSCASRPDEWAPIDLAVGKDDFPLALSVIQTSQDGNKKIYKKNNEISLGLDKGLLEHYSQDFSASYNDLLQTENLIKSAETKSVSQGFGSWLTNDNARDYSGEDYEDIYVNIFNALNAFHLENGNAYAIINGLVASGGELQKLPLKYNGSENKAKEGLEGALKVAGTVFSIGTINWPQTKTITLTDSVLARYLGAIFATAEDSYDNAAYQLYAFSSAVKTPLYEKIRLPNEFIVQGERGYETAPFVTPAGDMGALNILAFAGLSPVKIERQEEVLFPFLAWPEFNVATLHVPSLLDRQSRVAGITVLIDSGAEKQTLIEMSLLEDISDIITDTFNGHYSDVFLKTFVQTLLRFIPADIVATSIYEKTLKDTDSEFRASLGAHASALLSRAAFEAIARPDLRGGRYFPGRAFVGKVDLPPGAHSVEVIYHDAKGRTVFAEKKENITIRAGKVHLVESVSLK